jgi:hypothetical protein
MMVCCECCQQCTHLQSMRDDKYSRAFEVILDDFSDRRISLSVDTAGSFVEDKDLVASKQGSCDHQQLFLSDREATVNGYSVITYFRPPG